MDTPTTEIRLFDTQSGADLGPATHSQLRAAKKSVHMRVTLDGAGGVIDSATALADLPPDARMVEVRVVWRPDAQTPARRDIAASSASQAVPASAAASQLTSAAPQTWKQGDVANGHVLTAEGSWVPLHDPSHDAAALEAYRQQALRYRESITGWKPLVFWYGVWLILSGIGTISALLSGEAGLFFFGLVITGLLFMYTRYLFRGGTRRVWFFIF